jgi:hypothetical protein
LETPGEKLAAPRAALVIGAALGAAGFSPGDSKRELRGAKNRLIIFTQRSSTCLMKINGIADEIKNQITNIHQLFERMHVSLRIIHTIK